MAGFKSLRGLVFKVLGREDSVDHEVLVGEAQQLQLSPGAIDFVDCAAVRAGHEHKGRRGRVGQRVEGDPVPVLSLGEAGQRSNACGTGGTRVEEAGPRRWQREQSQGVTRRRCVKDDVVVLRSGLWIGQQCGELVKGRDLHGARARELLFDPAHDVVGQYSTNRADDAISVRRSGGIRIDIECVESRNAVNLMRRASDGGAEHFGEVRCRVGRHEQNMSPHSGQGHCRCRRKRCLADTALAGEEHESSGASEEFLKHGNRRSTARCAGAGLLAHRQWL